MNIREFDMGETILSLQEQMDDMAVLVYFRGTKGYMTPDERQIYTQVLGRVKDRGYDLVNKQVLRTQHARLVKQASCLEVLHPFLKD
jgi:hypothetical protein